jgi:hypothetical protein
MSLHKYYYYCYYYYQKALLKILSSMTTHGVDLLVADVFSMKRQDIATINSQTVPLYRTKETTLGSHFTTIIIFTWVTIYMPQQVCLFFFF